ncbi:MAG: DUF3800 domain-containing protein [Sandaracinus sp.]|nr:DUF3800 domain-containing protein [Sandaracinus sp.]
MLAFVDESGDPNLDVAAGGTSHFAICAVCVADEELASFRTAAEALRKRYFQTGEIKSSTVGTKNRKRRLEILRAMADVGYRGYALVIDKERLRRDTGLEFRPSFMKYFSRFVYDPLLRAHPQARVVADRHGSDAFMASFGDYHRKKGAQLRLDLPGETPISFEESAQEVGIQWADFVAGSLRIAYSEAKDDRFRELYESISPQLMTLRHWPPGPRLEQPEPDESESTSIGPYVVKAAIQWLREHDGEGLDDDKRRVVLLALLDAAEEKSPYLTLKALHERVCAQGHDVSDDFVRRDLISSLRDQGVVIAAATKAIAFRGTSVRSTPTSTGCGTRSQGFCDVFVSWTTP